jgi:hypothetical protein
MKGGRCCGNGLPRKSLHVNFELRNLHRAIGGIPKSKTLNAPAFLASFSKKDFVAPAFEPHCMNFLADWRLKVRIYFVFAFRLVALPLVGALGVSPKERESSFDSKTPDPRFSSS